jgi:hypothetical protein
MEPSRPPGGLFGNQRGMIVAVALVAIVVAALMFRAMR